MSINFNEEVNDETMQKMQEVFGDKLKAFDRKIALIEGESIDAKDLKEIANTANQPATLEIHSVGDVKTMSDGTQYKVTKSGWRKV